MNRRQLMMTDPQLPSQTAPKLSESCDSFVALPPVTANGCVIFAKNSDRPSTEVQEVVHCPAHVYPAGTTLECTYITIDQSEHTHAVILSKPAWCWGAEMGANEYGVCIGNEAVYTKQLDDGEGRCKERLIGMDLVRLGLERAKTAREGVDLITSILERYGQGGNCSEDRYMEWTYDNSYLIADRSEAWVLETAGRGWVAQKVTGPVRNLSNLLTIGTQYDLMSDGLKELAQTHGLWSPNHSEEFNFAKVFSEFDSNPTGHWRYVNGKRLMDNVAEKGSCTVESLFSVLRDVESGICMGEGTTSSQVSILSPPESLIPCCHWLTGTPGPHLSLFKPFIFVPEAKIENLTVSPNEAKEVGPAKLARFQKKIDRRHPLYVAHEKFIESLETGEKKAKDCLKSVQTLERKLLSDMESLCSSLGQSEAGQHAEVKDIFYLAAKEELQIYNKL